MASLNRRLAAALFAILILAAVLLFGAVDRLVQIALLFGLALGFLLVPPELPKLPRAWAIAVLGFAAFVILAQFLPFKWFGETVWHRVLARDFEVAFPWTRNPEPSRAVDCIFMGLLAVGWFFWVRTLAADLWTRAFLLWSLFLAAAIVATVSLALGTRPDYLIYGYRYTPGWTGFGPFPNRNHTAALLAMGALAGCGCMVRSARRHAWGAVVVALAAVAVIMLALLESKSRGGLLGLVCGATLFAGLSVLKLRSRSAVAASLAGVLLCTALILSFGSKVLSRFEGPGDANIPNNLRWAIWDDANRVWLDAPLWGHGLGTFAQIYPLYQTVDTPEQVVLHPESGWLLWLVELGAIPVFAGAAALLWFFGKYMTDAVTGGGRGFFLRAGAFAGFFAILCHSIWDVPSHRWGTAAFGLALLAVACPPLRRKRQVRLNRLFAGAPVAVAVYWMLPFLGLAPLWSPDGTRALLARLAYSPLAVSLSTLKQVESAFPLNAQLHQQIGLREMALAHRNTEAWREFRIADRLIPGSWAFPAVQGWVSREASPGMSLHFWSVSLERSGRRAPDLFLAAYRNTCDLAGSDAFWRNYTEGHPEFLLEYSENITDQDLARQAFEAWWKTRGSTGAGLEAWEAPEFYAAARKWGDPAQLAIWMNRRHSLEESDYRYWARLFHGWRLDADAWKILARRIREPKFPSTGKTPVASDILAANWVANPTDPISAEAYALDCDSHGNPARAEQVILSVAAGKNPPLWFIEKAAYLYAAKGDFTSAVNTLLRAPGGGA